MEPVPTANETLALLHFIRSYTRPSLTQPAINVSPAHWTVYKHILISALYEKNSAFAFPCIFSHLSLFVGNDDSVLLITCICAPLSQGGRWEMIRARLYWLAGGACVGLVSHGPATPESTRAATCTVSGPGGIANTIVLLTATQTLENQAVQRTCPRTKPGIVCWPRTLRPVC